MEENQSPAQESTPPTTVSFPSVNEPRSSNAPKMLLIVGILILVAILGFVIYKSSTDTSGVAQPTPFEDLTATLEPLATPSAASTSPTPTVASTPKPSDKEGVSIQVQNGTGITGEAAFLQTQLKNLGYTDVEVGNAPTQNATATEVTFAKSLSTSVVSELTQKLNSLYATVNSKTATSPSTDVVIVTGLRKGATPKPSVAPSPTASPKASSSASPTASPSPTP